MTNPLASYERDVEAARSDAVLAILRIADAYFELPRDEIGDAGTFLTRSTAFEAIESIERQLRMARDRILMNLEPLGPAQPDAD